MLDVLEEELRVSSEGFAERRETSAEYFGEYISALQNLHGLTFCAFTIAPINGDPWKASYRVTVPVVHNTVMEERTDVLKEMGLGCGEDDAIHPQLVVLAGNRDGREEAPFGGSRPLSSHQSACDQRLPAFFVRWYAFKDAA